jgi:hypothetical protein
MLQREILQERSDGLIMRRADPSDAECLSAFNARIHGEDPLDAEGVAAWTRDLLTLPHPTFHPDDFVIVEDPATGEIVSSLNLISQTWSYEGIEFGVGRPELVGTDDRYRNRGIVRAQFDVIHEWSRQRGELVQVITGIPYFYRQFGYEFALNLSGGKVGFEQHVPKLPEGEEEPYIVRPAVEADLSFLMMMYRRDISRSMVAAIRNEAEWRDDLLGKSPKNINRFDICVIETRDGRPVGYLTHPWFLWGTMQVATQYELDEGISYRAVTSSVIRYLWKIGKEHAEAQKKTLSSFALWLGVNHSVYQVAPDWLVQERKPYAFYVRVPDLPAFFLRIAPVLERRIAESALAGHSGELKVSFYRDGLRLVFENGRIVTVETWKPRIKVDEGHVSFPDLTFLQLLFGYRSLEELSHAYPDIIWKGGEARALLETLFPKKRSDIWPIS